MPDEGSLTANRVIRSSNWREIAITLSGLPSQPSVLKHFNTLMESAECAKRLCELVYEKVS